MYICTPQQIRNAEAITVGEDENGYLKLMENAGAEFASAVLENTPEPDGKKVIVLCGKGNNGGDGFVAARLLSKRMNVTAALMTDSAPTGIAGEEFARMQGAGVKIVSYSEILSDDADVICDAVFGIGFHGELPENVSLVFTRLLQSRALKFAVDIPSGINALTGAVSRCAFPADITVTFGAVKLGMTLPPASGMCGEIIVAPIGLEQALASPGNAMRRIDERTALSYLPHRDEYSHKGSFGRLLVIGGSRAMSGAAALNVRSALSSGAGLVRLASVRSVIDRVASGIYECTFAELAENTRGEISPTSLDTVEEYLMNADTAAIGSGLGATEDTALLVKETIRICGRKGIPLVIDADAINVLAGQGHIIKQCRAVLTPHPRELARLLGVELASVMEDRYAAAVKLSELTRAVVVSKGYPTYIISPDGRAAVSYTGNAGLSKGGSGDVLTGLISGILTSNRGERVFESACAGVYIFGAAADITAQRLSMSGMLPSDVINDFNEIFKRT